MLSRGPKASLDPKSVAWKWLGAPTPRRSPPPPALCTAGYPPTSPCSAPATWSKSQCTNRSTTALGEGRGMTKMTLRSKQPLYHWGRGGLTGQTHKAKETPAAEPGKGLRGV